MQRANLKHLIVVGVTGLATCAAAQSTVPAQRLAVLSKGANVCRWFRSTDINSESHNHHYISHSEMAMMRSMGLRHIRLCVDPKMLFDVDAAAPKKRELLCLDGAIRGAIHHGLGVVLDIHNEDPTVEGNPAWERRFTKFWGRLAHHYRLVNPDKLFFEIINEPGYTGRESHWNSLQSSIVAAIRKSAPHHTIIASAPNGGSIDGLANLRLLKDRNVVYSFHYFDPFVFQHDSQLWNTPLMSALTDVPYPSSKETVQPLLTGKPVELQEALQTYGAARWDRNRLAARLSEAIAWGNQNGVPVYCGELGLFPAVTNPEQRANWFSDAVGILSQGNVGWAVWGWDEECCLNRQKTHAGLRYNPSIAKAIGLRPVGPVGDGQP